MPGFICAAIASISTSVEGAPSFLDALSLISSDGARRRREHGLISESELRRAFSADQYHHKFMGEQTQVSRMVTDWKAQLGGGVGGGGLVKDLHDGKRQREADNRKEMALMAAGVKQQGCGV